MIEFEFIDDREPCIYEGPTLYKLDSTGRLRTWKMQIDGNGRYRTLSGLADGKQAESGWTTPVARSCATVKDQGEFEVRAQYKHQLDREYHATLDTVNEPNFFEPMLAKTYATFPTNSHVYSQPKLDGIRCIARAEGLFSRQGQPIIAVPHVHAALAPLFVENPDLILDGELYNHDLREDFGAISSIVRKKNPTAEALAKAEAIMQYHVYDVPSVDGSFTTRIAALEEMALALDCPWVVVVPTLYCGSASDLDHAYGGYLEAGYEGQMVRLDGPYEQKRSKHLLKRKEFITAEYPVVAIEEGNGNWAGAAKRMTLRLADGREFGAGIKGSYDRGVALLKEPVTNTSVATLRYFQLSPDGVPRFPVVIDYHPQGRID